MKRFLPFLLSVCILVSAGVPVLAADDDYAAIPATADSYIINGILSGFGLQLFSSGMSVSELDAAIGDLWDLFRSDVSAGAWVPDPSWNTNSVNFFSVYSELKSAIHTPNYVGLAAPVTDVNIPLVAALYVTVHPVIYNSVLAFRDWYVWKYMGNSNVVSVLRPSSGGISMSGPYLVPDVNSVSADSFSSGAIPYSPTSNEFGTYVISYFSSGNAFFQVRTFTRTGSFYQFQMAGNDSTSLSWKTEFTIYAPYGSSCLLSYDADHNTIVPWLYSGGTLYRLQCVNNSYSNPSSIAQGCYVSRALGFSGSSMPVLTYGIPLGFTPTVDLPYGGSLDIWDDSDPVGTPIDEPSDVPVIIGLGDLVGSLGDLLSGTRDFVVHSIEVGADAATNIRDALQSYIDKVGAATDDLAVSVPGASSISLQGTIVKADDVPAEIPTDTPSGFTPIIPIPDLNLSNLGTAFRSIWHYIEEWLATFRSGISWFFNLFSYLPYALVVPLYAGIAFMLIFYILKKVGF